MGAARWTASVLIFAAHATSSPIPTRCQSAADAFCATDCFPAIKGSGCDGPLVARDSGPNPTSWRCYSPSTLQHNQTYKSGHCFCSRDKQIKGVLAKCAPPPPIKVVRVFSARQANIACFRIPAIVKTSKGTLIAFAEARHGSCNDNSNNNLAAQRSNDNGKTWSDFQIIAGNATHQVSNPYPIAMMDGAIVVVFRDWTSEGNGMVTSNDDGATWSFEHDISEEFGAAKGAEPGPGAGVAILISTGHSATGNDSTASTKSGPQQRLVVASHQGSYSEDYITTSDDGGASWSTVPGTVLCTHTTTELIPLLYSYHSCTLYSYPCCTRRALSADGRGDTSGPRRWPPTAEHAPPGGEDEGASYCPFN
jgi:hypothetical protein